MIWDVLLAPFVDFGFMRRALLGCIAVSVGATPVGVFLMLRHMSLTGDAMAHAILPGAATGYLVSGLSLGAMTVGGLIAGMLVALASGFVARVTSLREDASLAAFYLISLAIGVLIVSTHGNNVDLMHVLFGTVLALDDTALILLCSFASVSLLVLALLFRPLVLECADPQFLLSQQVECDYPFCFLGACGDELGRRVPCAGHFNGGRYYDFTRRCSEVLGGNNRWLDRCCRVDRDALKRDRVTLIVSLQSPLGASNHFGGRYRLWAVNYLWAGGGRNCAKPTTP